jgi:hypothetical protein
VVGQFTFLRGAANGPKAEPAFHFVEIPPERPGPRGSGLARRRLVSSQERRADLERSFLAFLSAALIPRVRRFGFSDPRKCSAVSWRSPQSIKPAGPALRSDPI